MFPCEFPAGYSLISINTNTAPRLIGRTGRKLDNSDGDASAKPPSVTASVATGNEHPGERKSHRISFLFLHFIRLRHGAGETSRMKKCETKSEPERKKKNHRVNHQMLMQM
jgi:hypothetical protein